MATDLCLQRILTVCLSLEEAMMRYYHGLSGQAANAAAAFWLGIARDEERHGAYWRDLLSVAVSGTLRNPFEHAQDVLNELASMLGRVEDLAAGRQPAQDPVASLLTAMRIESLMLHPAVAVLYHALGENADGTSPERDYEEHIAKFGAFVRESGWKSAGLDLVADLLCRMWALSRETADQFAHIRTLRGIIPICAGCKRIRDDKGYWDQVESYVSRHSDAEFTHGLCPECVRKLYPEIAAESVS